MTATATTPAVQVAPAAAAKPERSKGPLHHVGMALSFVLLLFVGFIAAAVIVVPIASNSTPYTVLTSSMEPTYPPGSLVVVKPIDPAQIKVGDVITYQLKSGEASVVTHRVTAVQQTPGEETTFITKGDNNDVADAAPVRPVQVRGAVWYGVPLIGWVNNVINGDARSIIIPVVAVALFGYAGFMFTSGLVSAARKRRQDAAEAEAASPSDTLDLAEGTVVVERAASVTDESLAELLRSESRADDKTPVSPLR